MKCVMCEKELGYEDDDTYPFCRECDEDSELVMGEYNDYE